MNFRRQETSTSSHITPHQADTRVSTSRNGIEIRRQGRPITSGPAGTAQVYLVIDCSYSMEGKKIASAKEGALRFSLEAQAKGYAVGVIRFSSEAQHICDPTHEMAGLDKYLMGLTPDGSTNLAAGMEMATSKLGQGSGQRAMVIITDGQPDSREATFAAAYAAKRAGIDIITIGTDDADQGMLRELATRSDLAIMVPSNQLGEGIAATARMLPG